MCYPGQNFDMSVPVPEGAELGEPGLLDLAERFHDQHETERGFCFRNQQPLLRGVRVTARGLTPKPDHFAETGTAATPSQAHQGHAPRLLRRRLRSTRRSTTARSSAPARAIEGPALIEEPFTVVVLPPGTTARARRPRQLRHRRSDRRIRNYAAWRYLRTASGANTAMMPMLHAIDASTLAVSA